MSNPPEKPSGRGSLPPQLPNRLGRSLMSWAFVIMAMLLVAFFLYRTADNHKNLTPQEFWTYAENGNLRGTLVIGDKEIDGELADQTPGM
jgi:hypothetical protein